MDQELLDLIVEQNGSEHDALIVLWERFKMVSAHLAQLAEELYEAERPVDTHPDYPDDGPEYYPG